MPSTIRCKMICHHSEPLPSNSNDMPMSRVRFGAVWSPESGTPGDENAVFGKYTPFAEFSASMTTAVAEQLEVGVAYYVDILKAQA